MNTSPSSFISAALSAYKQSITDIKSVGSLSEGLTRSYNSFTDTGPFFMIFSTIGINDNVLFLYEYSLFGNCIEHLTLCNKVTYNNLAINIFLQAYLMNLL